MSMADSDSASRRSLLGLGGLASLCCLGTGAAVVGGGAAAGGGAAVAGAGGGLVQIAVTVMTLAVIGVVLRWRSGCSDCSD